MLAALIVAALLDGRNPVPPTALTLALSSISYTHAKTTING